MKQRGFTAVELIIYLLFMATIVVPLFRGMFVTSNVGVRALEAQGFTNVRIIDNSFFAVGVRGCDAQDAARITAIVTNSQGKDATLYVCAGWPFKGATVRNP